MMLIIEKYQQEITAPLGEPMAVDSLPSLPESKQATMHWRKKIKDVCVKVEIGHQLAKCS